MRLIDADALLNSGFPTIYHTEFGYEVINTDDIRNAPTVEERIEYGTDGQPYRLFMSGGQVVPDMLQGWRYEERPTGKWILDETEQFCYCSNCEDTFYPRPLDPSWNFCPHCGADMKGAADEEEA